MGKGFLPLSPDGQNPDFSSLPDSSHMPLEGSSNWSSDVEAGEVGVSEHCCKQDTSTKLNSSFLLLKRLMKQQQVFHW